MFHNNIDVDISSIVILNKPYIFSFEELYQRLFYQIPIAANDACYMAQLVWRMRKIPYIVDRNWLIAWPGSLNRCLRLAP